MYKLAFFVPSSQWTKVKKRRIRCWGRANRAYDQCSWQVLGQGQFRPLDGSQPFIGQSGVVEFVEEWKVELVVADDLIQQVVLALKQSHPYETPAYEVWRLEDF
ncbi:NGG1p interacting factor NIF3 [Pseudomonas syringae pv. actinidiae]|nr:NGG1p interacting factor NIF3 [Pseudomonas syringae pv. actinidiae]